MKDLFKLILGVLASLFRSRAKLAGTETTAPQQYRSFSVCLALSRVPILHTNLGRAILADTAIAAATMAMREAVALEMVARSEGNALSRARIRRQQLADCSVFCRPFGVRP
jgi:seryl-tRNA(Sec) selenium transferase